jgi:hypothetical protein
LLFFGANGKRSSHDQRQGSDDGTDLATSNLSGSNDKETTHGDAAQNDSAANRNTNTTALRIIIDLPSYKSLLYVIQNVYK